MKIIGLKPQSGHQAARPRPDLLTTFIEELE